jgi:DNA repair exonuclease SbcCD nuclease subunit
MRILHFSDTHLGFQAFDRVNAEGINAREQDVYDAFERTVERMLEKRPDLVVHSGDFFHRPSPSNRALTFGLEQLRRFCDAGIPVVLIAGNHETPKTIYNSPILRALRNLNGIYPIFGDTSDRFDFGSVVVHGVPHINDARLLHTALERLVPDPRKFNLLLLHTSLGKRYLMDEYGETVFPAAFESQLDGFQYIALGHWHNMQQVEQHPNAWYAGSTERLSDTEAGTAKGFLSLDLSGGGSPDPVFEVIPTRPWIKWELNRCNELSVAEIDAELLRLAGEHDIKDTIISLYFNDIRPEQAIELNNLRLKQVFAPAFQLLTKRKTLQERTSQHIEAAQFDRLDKIFAGYLRSKYDGDEATVEKLIEQAKKYFSDDV